MCVRDVFSQRTMAPGTFLQPEKLPVDFTRKETHPSRRGKWSEHHVSLVDVDPEIPNAHHCFNGSFRTTIALLRIGLQN